MKISALTQELISKKYCLHNFRTHRRHNQFGSDWLMRHVFCLNPSWSLRAARVIHGLYPALDLSLDLCQGMLDTAAERCKTTTRQPN